MSLDNARYYAAALALRRWSADLVRFAYSYLLNHADAQDAVQDAFVSYMKHAPVFSDTEAEKAWLIRVTANKCKNMLRSGWFKSREPLSEELPADEESREVIRAMGKLPGKYRWPVHLHYYEGYSIAEIAQMLGAREATVGTWLSRGRELLRRELGGTEE